MEAVNYLIQSLANLIDWPIVMLVIMAGVFQKKYLADWSLRGELKTLFISFIITGIYLLIIGDLKDRAMLATYFFSYIFATSFYEILLKKVLDWIFGLGNKKDENE